MANTFAFAESRDGSLRKVAFEAVTAANREDMQKVLGPEGERKIREDTAKFYGEVLGINRVNLAIPPGITSLVVQNENSPYSYVSVSGPIDYVSDGERMVSVSNS